MIKTKLDPSIVAATLTTCLNKGVAPIALHEPSFRGNEWLFVKDCLDTGWVSSVGKYVDKFEQELAAFTGVKRAVAVVNGTASLQIAFEVAGVCPGDEVLVPDLTFVATTSAVKHCGANPHFVDISVTSLGVDPQKLREGLEKIGRQTPEGLFNLQTGKKISALVVVHTFGHPAEMDELAEICSEFKLTLVEDAAESIGSYYKGQHTGNVGLVSTLSFNGNKTITTGGGGAILTNDARIGEIAKHITTTAKIPHRWKFAHDRVGYNFRMPNINAALGCAQLESLPLLLSKKRDLAARYQIAFEEIPGVKFLAEPKYGKSNYWLNTLILDEDQAQLRDPILELTNNQGIQTRPAWEPMHTLPMYADCQRMDVSNSISMASRIINIPSSPCLTPDV